MPTPKRCSACGEEKDVSMFHRRKEGLQSYCNPCAVQKNKDRIGRDPEHQRRIQKRHHMKKSYGISLEDYERMLGEQNGRCAICDGGPDGAGREHGHLAVDHDHDTGRVRGLLCSKCNVALGLFRDRQDLLVAAGEYLAMRGGASNT